MTIKHITISGFKSFARKTTLRFDGGITAIVGPNGSGKSNVADALRWVLGEQSVKALRVKKTEDLIFAGTATKARASVAEVTVVFDNSDGAAPIGLAEVELSRKLYGSGESDYRLNGRKVRLSEVQELLAAARLGASSYAITSQGTIDSLILSTPAERKLLFEEASGIRHFELQRASVLKRLRLTEENMQRARDVLAELSPRLRSLERSVETAQKREVLKTEVADIKIRLIAAERGELNHEKDRLQTSLERLSGELAEHNAAIASLTADQTAAQLANQRLFDNQKTALRELNQLEAVREQLLNDSSVQQAELQHLNQRLKAGPELDEQCQNLATQSIELERALSDLRLAIGDAITKQELCQTEREELISDVRKLQQSLVRQRKSLQDDNQHGYVTHAQTIATDLYRALQEDNADTEQLRSLVFRVRRLLMLATEKNSTQSLERLQQLQTALGGAIRNRETIDERHTQATLNLRKLELDVAAAEQQLARAGHEHQQLLKEVAGLSDVRANIKHRQQKTNEAQKKLESNQAAIKAMRAGLGQPDNSSLEEAVELARRIEAHVQQTKELETAMQDSTAQLSQVEVRLTQLPPKVKASADTVSQLQHTLTQAESRLDTLQELSLDVDREHTETKERHDFLVSQLSDLEAAQLNLNRVTHQLDEAIAAQFGSAFAEISQGFDKIFQRLFEGGGARLVLDSSSDVLGIEIEVSPPGKRIRHLTALSGGERTLAGIALLAAIVQANPSPILVLDEVDAALDEANAARCNQLLRELAVNSQIVLITHNTQTMIAAMVLFGVTMDQEQVSSLVSVHLDEAAALAHSAA